MAKSINLVMLMGRLTRDPEQRTTTTGKTVVNFSLAVNNGEDDVNFFDVTAWNKTGELVAKYLSKGRQAIVQGRLNTTSWTDKESGKKRSRVEVVANEVHFVGSKGDGEQQKDVAPEDIDDKPIDLSEIPF